MSYRAPVADIVRTMREVAGLDAAIAEGLYGDLTLDLTLTVMEEAGRFASERIAPLNRVGDGDPARLEGGGVTTSKGWPEAYRDWSEAGWNGLGAPTEWGGQGLPALVAAGATEIWNSACMAFGLCPVLTDGAVEALHLHGSEALKQAYLGKLVSGEWTGTMNLTEPGAGSDLSAIRTRAARAEEGGFRLTGTKIYITYGEHDMTDNIVHFVLARIDGAVEGTRGISLFLVPKILPDGARNDVRCAGLEHKLGIHASPTCTMVYGDEGGALGWLVGQEGRGLNCMFTMMNNARLKVGLQGVAVAERATQAAIAFAAERRQGRAAGHEGMAPIVVHADVRRMLMTMRAMTAAARAICYLTAANLDRARLHPDEAARRAAHERASLLTPVAKAFATDIGVEVASLGVQVHGGMGYVEETGAAQHLRDARILPIYEGTNGIQAADLVTRKLPLSGGAAVRAAIADMRRAATALVGRNDPAFGGMAARLREGVESLDRSTSFLLGALQRAPDDALAGASPYLRLFGLVQGGASLARLALGQAGAPEGAGGVALARFYAENLLTAAPGLEASILDGAASIHDAPLALAS